jgi:hypothetical protein
VSAGAAWERLVRAALLGTERQAEPADAATGDPALDGAVAALEVEPAEARLLGTAALLDAWRRAGQRAGRTAMSPAATAPAPDAEERPATPLAAGVLRQVLAGTSAPLLAEWMALADAAGVTAPHELLPAVLDYGVRHAAAREEIARSLGARGRWLAAQNPAWSFATEVPADPAAGWETGSAEERLRILGQVRETDPAAGLSLVQSTWKSDPARDRAGFVEALATGLSMDDEPFLESALDDRSKQVREASARLLSALPGSRLVARMVERLTPLLRPSGPPGLLARLAGGSARILVELPAECDAGMQRDGIVSQLPGAGERTWWLRQMLAAVPPSVWSARWEMDPAACLAAAHASEEGPLLLSAWTMAAVRGRDAAWAEALLRAGSGGDAASVAELLAPEQLEAVALERLRPLDVERLRPAQNGLVSGHPAAVLLQAARFPWSPELTRAALRAVPREDPWYGLAELLRALAPYMHPATAVATLRELGDPHEGKWVDLVHLRHTLHQAFQ